MSFEEILQIIAWKYVWNCFADHFLLFGLYVTIGTRFFKSGGLGYLRNTVGKIVEARRGKGPVF